MSDTLNIHITLMSVYSQGQDVYGDIFRTEKGKTPTYLRDWEWEKVEEKTQGRHLTVHIVLLRVKGKTSRIFMAPNISEIIR